MISWPVSLLASVHLSILHMLHNFYGIIENHVKLENPSKNVCASVPTPVGCHTYGPKHQ
ncbi:hypothetical protein HanXRQr2_Chr05g0234811 [Helianthus annuus]|uniref:Uncharacterized protein n=1 Tax=Helianthus annuus TaxID=4232 RepID=A0A9K3J2V4_HELAN|nr:hypothetical protein HanXRQr2_Chr05g0234811 [Helianthus annuus]KAJ0924298.1 hypothetical protein HanPSC8_Chr05g0226601 [Helianthus annuus]